MIARPTRWMRRTALLACLLGAAVLGGGYLAIGAAGDGSQGPRSLTGEKPSAKAYESSAKLPPLPKKLRARVVQPEAGAATPVEPASEPE